MTENAFLELAVSVSIQVALVVGVVSLLARGCRCGDWLCRLWSLGHWMMLLLVVVAVSVPHVRLFHPWTRFEAPVAVELVRWEIGLGRILFVLWLFGALVATIWFLFRSVQASRFLKTCSPLDEKTDILKSIGRTRQGGESAKKHPVRFLTSPLISGPCCWQFHRPYVVLPEYLLTMNPREVRFVVRHELAHLRTGHPLQLLIQRLVQVVFWFHPAVYWSFRQAAVARENACDEAALDSSDDIRDYLTTLLAIATRTADLPDATPSLLNFGRASSMIASRTQWLIRKAEQREVDRRGPTARAAGICLVCVTALFTLVWVPLDILASPRSSWSPWPKWSARVFHDFGFVARDFEVYDPRFQLYELLEEGDEVRFGNAD